MSRKDREAQRRLQDMRNAATAQRGIEDSAASGRAKELGDRAEAALRPALSRLIATQPTTTRKLWSNRKGIFGTKSTEGLFEGFLLVEGRIFMTTDGRVNPQGFNNWNLYSVREYADTIASWVSLNRNLSAPNQHDPEPLISQFVLELETLARRK